MSDQIICLNCHEVNLAARSKCGSCGRSLDQSRQWESYLNGKWAKIWIFGLAGALFTILLFNDPNKISDMLVPMLGLNSRIYLDKPLEVDVLWHGGSVKYGEGSASLEILVLNEDYNWRFGWTDKLNGEYDRVPFTDWTREKINRATRVVCIGTGTADSVAIGGGRAARLEEENRTRRRADTLAKWMWEISPDRDKVLTWNWGSWVNPGGERGGELAGRVMLVLVYRVTGNWDRNQALAEAFRLAGEDIPAFNGVLAEYSLTRSGEFDWQ